MVSNKHFGFLLFCGLLIWSGRFPLLCAEDSPTFFRANPAGEKVELFALGIADWKALAPAKFTEMDFKNPPASSMQLLKEKRGMFSSVELDYFAPLPDNIKESSFYLISTDGIEPLKAEQLHGKIQYFLDSSGETITEPPNFYGAIVAQVEGKKSPPRGFAVCSKKPLSFIFTKVEINVRDYPRLLDQYRMLVVRTLENGSRKWEIQQSFGFRFAENGETFAFVLFKPEKECCCTYMASLLTVGKSPRELVENQAGCDI